MSLPTALAVCPMAMKATTHILSVNANISHTVSGTIIPFLCLFQLRQKMAHCFVKEVFCECLRVVCSKRRNHGDDHLPNQRILVRLEAKNLIGNI